MWTHISRWISVDVKSERGVIDCKLSDEMRARHKKKRKPILPYDKNDEVRVGCSTDAIDELRGFRVDSSLVEVDRPTEDDSAEDPDSERQDLPIWIISDREIRAWNVFHATRFGRSLSFSAATARLQARATAAWMATRAQEGGAELGRLPSRDEPEKWWPSPRSRLDLDPSCCARHGDPKQRKRANRIAILLDHFERVREITELRRRRLAISRKRYVVGVVGEVCPTCHRFPDDCRAVVPDANHRIGLTLRLVALVSVHSPAVSFFQPALA